MVDLGGQQPRSVQFSQNRAGDEDYAGNASRHYAGTKYYFILQLRVKQGSIAYTPTPTCVSGPANAGTPGFTHMGTELQPPVIADKPSTGELGAVRTPRCGVLLMSNTLEVGGSERQFVALVDALNRDQFEVHPACIRRTGPLVQRVGDIPEFPVGGSLFLMQSQRARWAMARSMRQNHVTVAHAFDFYSNMMLV